MISFKEFINEDVNNNFLYHGTSFIALRKILKDSKISPHTFHYGAITQGKKVYGTSFTRNFNVARHMGDVIIAIPRWSLKQTNKILPLNYLNTDQAKNFHDDPILKFANTSARVKPSSLGKFKIRTSMKDSGEFNEYEEFVIGEVSLKRKNHMNENLPLITLFFDDIHAYSIDDIKSGKYGNFNIKFF